MLAKQAAAAPGVSTQDEKTALAARTHAVSLPQVWRQLAANGAAANTADGVLAATTMPSAITVVTNIEPIVADLVVARVMRCPPCRAGSISHAAPAVPVVRVFAGGL
jgi:hypothetical protein